MTAHVHRSGRNGRKGFNLVELVVALSVVAIALTAILVIFPLALKMVQNSQRESRVVLMAQTVLDELTAGGGITRAFLTNDVRGINGQMGDKTSVCSGELSLTTQNPGDIHYIVYDEYGNPAGETSADIYNSGAEDKAYMGVIKAVLTDTYDSMATVTVQIEWPACATAGKRKSQTFITLLSPYL